MAGFDSSSSRAMATLNRLTPLQKVALGAAVLTAVAGTVVMTRTGSNPAMAALYTDLEARDASSVTDELISRNVDYELADGGQTVLVPKDDVYDLRISLSGEGLPASNEGYALLDQQGITTSEFRQRIDYQRALEGELSRTLRSIDGIDAATVHLALPEDSVFVDEPEDATASVLVRSAGPTAVASDQVAAMVHLVAASVKGMAPEDVTIPDASGRVLTDPATAGSIGGGDALGQATTSFERDLAASLRAMVSRVAGPGNVAVNVQAELELTQRQQTSERFDNTDENGVVVAERTASETYAGIDPAGETGVLGPDGAVDGGTSTDGAEKSYTKDDAERTFAVNRTVEQTTFAPGAIQQLHVAVLVDEEAVTEEQRAAIIEMVSTAAGIDPDRGDEVVVTRLPFDTSATEAAAEAADVQAVAAAAEQRSSLIRTGIIAFVIVIAMFLAYRSARKARREVATPINIGEIAAVPADGPEPTTAIPEIQVLDAGAPSSQAALEELSTLADRRPEDVAQILQGWLADETVAQ